MARPTSTAPAIQASTCARASAAAEASKRAQAINELMEKLTTLPGESLEQRMRETIVADGRLGEEYEQWVRLILGRSHTTEES